ncbi:MAG: HD domain-containing protein [Cyanobacteria bacterium SIG27]|nr:HD domain-containing protein [Cyanobacteria bacterium SIG27]MBQ9150272.1 HD domain-containing protein [bacterium]
MLDLNAKYEILSFSVGDTKAGTKMGKMQIKNLENSSILNCVLWEETLNRTADISTRVGNIIRIITASYNEKYNNCLLNNFEVLEQAILGVDEEKREEYFNKILNAISEFKDEKLKNFVSDILIKNKEKFIVCPAAKQMHHNYIGGLVVHTYECVEMAQAVLPKVKKYLNKDEVIAAAILHDIGKIYEYDINLESGMIEYNEQFKKDWITHSQYGYTLCMSNGFLNIAKMIASHHGRADWGAMIDLGEKDLEPFYYIIHHVDDLSAKFGATSVNDVKNLN